MAGKRWIRRVAVTAYWLLAGRSMESSSMEDELQACGTERKACTPIVPGSPIWGDGSVECWIRRGPGDPEIAEALRLEAGGEWD